MHRWIAGACFSTRRWSAKFKDCGISVLDAPEEVLEIALIYLGRDPSSERLEDLQAGEAALLAIRPYVRYIHSSKYIDDLANGEICLALGWSGDAMQAAARARESGNGIKIDYRLPREGATSSSTSWRCRPMPPTRAMRSYS